MKSLNISLENHARKLSLLLLSLASLGGMAVVSPSSAKAAGITFDLAWSGKNLGFPNVSAVGEITFKSLPPNGTNTNGGAIAAGKSAIGVGSLNVPTIDLANGIISDNSFNGVNQISTFVESLTVTVTDLDYKTVDKYTLADFSGIIWDANYANFDFTKNLFGQSTRGGTWGTVTNNLAPCDPKNPIPSATNRCQDTGTIYSSSWVDRGKFGGAYAGDFNLFDDPNCIATGYQPFSLKTCRKKVVDGEFVLDSNGKPIRDNLSGAVIQLTKFELRPVPVPGAVFGVIVAGGLLAVSKKKKAVDVNVSK